MFVRTSVRILRFLRKRNVSCRATHTVSYGISVQLASLTEMLFKTHPAYHKKLLNETESYLVLVARQILLVTINKVY